LKWKVERDTEQTLLENVLALTNRSGDTDLTQISINLYLLNNIHYD